MNLHWKVKRTSWSNLHIRDYEYVYDGRQRLIRSSCRTDEGEEKVVLRSGLCCLLMNMSVDCYRNNYMEVSLLRLISQFCFDSMS